MSPFAIDPKGGFVVVLRIAAAAVLGDEAFKRSESVV
jgi:hypothetical protein